MLTQGFDAAAATFSNPAAPEWKWVVQGHPHMSGNSDINFDINNLQD